MKKWYRFLLPGAARPTGIIFAHTKSEARAILKHGTGARKRLPVGTIGWATNEPDPYMQPARRAVVLETARVARRASLWARLWARLRTWFANRVVC